jgi:hypothetical protein
MRGRELNSYAGRELPPAAAPPPRRSGCIFSARLAAPLCAALDAGRACVFSSRGMACGRHRRPAWRADGQRRRVQATDTARRARHDADGERRKDPRTCERRGHQYLCVSALSSPEGAIGQRHVLCPMSKSEGRRTHVHLRPGARETERAERDSPFSRPTTVASNIFERPGRCHLAACKRCTVPPCQSLTADSAVGCTGCM